MPNFQVVTVERYGQKRWKRYTSYNFAAADSVAPLVALELPKAALSLPIAFIMQNESYVPAAILGLQTGNNVFVTSDWNWVGPYVPAAFRSYPFVFANNDDGQQVLCFDEDSALLTDSSAGEAFFDDSGKPDPAVMNVVSFLNLVGQNRVVTRAACQVLQRHDLIRPWPITVKSDNGEQQITGFSQIDEAALNQLSTEALLEVRDSGGLLIAYCQMLSMQHLPLLGQLTDAQAKASAQAMSLHDLAPNGNLDLEFFNKGGTFNFGAMK